MIRAHWTVARWIGVALSAAILGFGLVSEDWQSLPWSLIGIVAFGLPLVLQLHSSMAWRIYALWFGAAMVLQSLATPLLKGDHVTLPPGMRLTVRVTADAIPGYPPGVRHVTTDERGWRVQPPMDYLRKSGPRVFAVGGSTTEDIALDDTATWAHRLQTALLGDFAGLRVINTGVSGLRARNHAATLAVVARLEPDVVLILLGGNDWNKAIKDHFEHGRGGWHPLPFRETALPRAIGAVVVAPLQRRMGAASPPAQSEIEIKRAEELMGNRTRAHQRSPIHSWVPQSVPAEYLDDLTRLGNLCHERRLRCVFVTQPHAYGLRTPQGTLESLFWMTPPYAAYGLDLGSMVAIADLYNAQLRRFAQSGQHGLCDLAAAMPADAASFYDDMHYTDRGAENVARVLSECVRSTLKGSLPSTSRP